MIFTFLLTCLVSLHGRCHVWTCLTEFSGVVPSHVRLAHFLLETPNWWQPSDLFVCFVFVVFVALKKRTPSKLAFCLV